MVQACLPATPLGLFWLVDAILTQLHVELRVVVVAACGENALLDAAAQIYLLLHAAVNHSAYIMPARGCLLGAVVHPTLNVKGPGIPVS